MVWGENQEISLNNGEISARNSERAYKLFKAKCIRNDTIDLLCQFKNAILTTQEQIASNDLKELLNAQDYLANETEAENEKEVLVILKSPEGKLFQTKIPRSFGEKQKLEITIAGEKITLVANPLTNGYNTDYEITSQKGERRQLAILFTLINPKWKKIKENIDYIKKQIKDLNEKVETLKALEKSLRKKLTGNAKKDKKVNLQLKKIPNEIKTLKEKIEDLKESLSNYQTELKKHEKHLNFPYSPYSKYYDTPENQDHGYLYLHQKTREAWGHLKGTKSLVNGEGKKLDLTQAFTPDLATVMNIVERMDYKKYFERDGKTPKKDEEIVKLMIEQINKNLTTLAMNQSGAFNWTRNEKSGALGIGQFMSKTYVRIRDRYPQAFPEKYNFEIGAKDHDTTFRMQGLHFHEETWTLPKWIKENWGEILKDEEAKIGLYALIAAGYNGKMPRIVEEAKLGDKFNKNVLHTKTLLENLSGNTETKFYVMKFIFAWNYLKDKYRIFGQENN